MSAFVNKTPAILVNGNLWQSQTNKITLDIECDIKEATTWKSSGAREFVPGVVSGKLAVEGFIDNTIGSEFFNNGGNNSTGVVTIITNNFSAATQTQYLPQSYSMLINETKYQVGGSIGEAETFTFDASVDYPLTRNFIQVLYVVTTTGYTNFYGWDAEDYLSKGQPVQLAIHHFQVQNTSSFQTYFSVSSSSGSAAGTSIQSFATTGIGSYQGQHYYGSGSWTTDRHFLRTSYFTSGATSKATITLGVIK